MFQVSESWDEKKTRHLRALGEREEELRDLQRQVETIRKRIRDLDVETAASQGQEKRPQCLLTTENASTASSYSEPGFDNPTSPVSQTAAGNDIGDNHNALPCNSAASASSFEALASSSHYRLMDITSAGLVGNVSTLLYYRELDGDAVVESRLLETWT